MARKRTIDPDIWGHEQLCELPVRTRYLYIATISLADDYGNLKAEARFLRNRVFPTGGATISDIEEMCVNLARANLLVLYSVRGAPYLNHPNWDRYQGTSHRFAPKYPSRTEIGATTVVLRSPTEDCVAIRRRWISPVSETVSVSGTESEEVPEGESEGKPGDPPESPRETAVLDAPLRIRNLEPPTRYETEVLKALLEIPGFRRDDTKNLVMIRELAKAYPKTDLRTVAEELGRKIRAGAYASKNLPNSFMNWTRCAAENRWLQIPETPPPWAAVTKLRWVGWEDENGGKHVRQERIPEHEDGEQRTATSKEDYETDGGIRAQSETQGSIPGHGGGTSMDRPDERTASDPADGEAPERGINPVGVRKVLGLVDGICKGMGRRAGG